MGHSVNYVVALGGRAFNDTLCQGQAASAHELEEFNREGMLWEFSLPGSSIRAAGDFSSDVATLLSIPIKYSWLVHGDPESEKAVERFESSLRKLLPTVHVTRVDELLVLDWAGSRRAEWLQDPQQVEALVDWLGSQDTRHWKLIQ